MPSLPATVDLYLPDLHLSLETDRGVFAYDQVDAGTKLLLARGPSAVESGDVLALRVGGSTIGPAGTWRRYTIAETDGPRFRRDLRNVDAAEGTGMSEWRLHPLKAGTVTLRFEYRRPRNLEPASEVATYAVTVR